LAFAAALFGIAYEQRPFKISSWTDELRDHSFCLILLGGRIPKLTSFELAQRRLTARFAQIGTRISGMGTTEKKAVLIPALIRFWHLRHLWRCGANYSLRERCGWYNIGI